MNISVLIQDLYLDFTFDKNVNLERRFFVEIEINKDDKEVLIFMNEMNSSFIKFEKLHNAVILENKDIMEEFNELEKEDKNKNYKELLILDKSTIYSTLKQMVVANIESIEDTQWIEYCKKRYLENKSEFTEDKKLFELNKFNQSNKKIKELWSNFPITMKEFAPSGEIEKAEKISEKFANFWTEAHFNHLNEKFKKQNIQEKKSKI